MNRLFKNIMGISGLVLSFVGLILVFNFPQAYILPNIYFRILKAYWPTNDSLVLQYNLIALLAEDAQLCPVPSSNLPPVQPLQTDPVILTLAGLGPQHSLESNFEILVTQRVEYRIQGGVQIATPTKCNI